MEQKKSPRANLENNRPIFFQIGLVISLAILLLAFECTRPTGELITLVDSSLSSDNDDWDMINTWQKEKPKPKPVIMKDILVLVDDDIDLEDELEIEDTEADQSTEIEDIGFEEEETIDDIPYITVQEQAEFPGGYSALNRFMVENIKYPELAQEINLTGTVYVRFVVTKSGKIGKVEIVRGVDPVLDDEAVRVVKLMPIWKPGKNSGKPVNCWFNMPIKFRLN